MSAKDGEIPKFIIYVSYSQVSVFHANIESPFNNWLPKHVEQGFAWRAESVGFKTLEENGDLVVYIAVKSTFELDNDCVRAIRVPFTVPNSGDIEIASISDGNELQIVPGNYSLFFETGINAEEGMWGRFTFCKEYSQQAEIVKSGKNLKISGDLLMTATPA